MKNVLKKIMTPVTTKYWYTDLLFAIPRILCGYFLAVNFGGSKFGVPWSPEGSPDLSLFEVVDWFPQDIAEYGGIFAMFPVFFAWMGAASEAIGGVFLALGLKTRIASFFIMCTMLVAIFFQKWGDGMWGMLPAMGFLWLSIYNLVLGSGRFGLDYILTQKLTFLKFKSTLLKLI
ncbi:DoxX family protein [Aquimarina sp. D1M17]|uniref:DoxX family protein n=1 Tax=Aquimarina acroporae TaxID=2937283 RepID=UPI0020BD54B4|nr:DoxX family protein [Aquimarina acroporae]MCK8519957.1 DoxX family protein [Aquimarina acroporae]